MLLALIICSLTALRAKFCSSTSRQPVQEILLGGSVVGAARRMHLLCAGPLDQGMWPEGLYAAPTAEALLFDLDATKAFGFNMVRKHAKVEPALWYA